MTNAPNPVHPPQQPKTSAVGGAGQPNPNRITIARADITVTNGCVLGVGGQSCCNTQLRVPGTPTVRYDFSNQGANFPIHAQVVPGTYDHFGLGTGVGVGVGQPLPISSIVYFDVGIQQTVDSPSNRDLDN